MNLKVTAIGMCTALSSLAGCAEKAQQKLFIDETKILRELPEITKKSLSGDTAFRYFEKPVWGGTPEVRNDTLFFEKIIGTLQTVHDNTSKFIFRSDSLPRGAKEISRTSENNKTLIDYYY